MRDHEQQHRGRVVDCPADNLRAECASVVGAEQCAVAMQRELKARNAVLPSLCARRKRMLPEIDGIVRRIYEGGL